MRLTPPFTDISICAGAYAITHQQKRPFQKQLAGTVCLTVLGFNVTKRYYTLPHYHKDTSHPLTLENGELHPYEKEQPAVSINERSQILNWTACLTWLCHPVVRCQHDGAQQARTVVLRYTLLRLMGRGSLVATPS